jgi:hypothetical protein
MTVEGFCPHSMTFIEHLVCVRHWVKCFTHSLSPPCKVDAISPFYREGDKRKWTGQQVVKLGFVLRLCDLSRSVKNSCL